MIWRIAIGILAAGSILLVACGGSNGPSSREDLDCCRAPSAVQTKSPAPTATSWIKEPAQPEPGTVDPCALVTQAEAEKTLGAAVREGQRVAAGSPLGQTICSYSTLGATPGLVRVSVFETAGLDEDLRRRGYTARQLFQDSKKLYATEPVSGVGDEAFLRGKGSIELLTGNVKVDISVTSVTPGAQPQPETIAALARTAVARIGK